MVLRRVPDYCFRTEGDCLSLLVSKSNYGPERLGMPLAPVRLGADDKQDGGAIVAFEGVPWSSWIAPLEKPSEGKAKSNKGAGKGGGPADDDTEGSERHV